jgi:hypothetical protein
VGWFISKDFLWKDFSVSPIASIARDANKAEKRTPKGYLSDDYITFLTLRTISFIQSHPDYFVLKC